jgi:hypothetical protein
MSEVENLKGVVVRRILHASLGLILLYYLFPDKVYGIPKYFLIIILFIILPLTIDLIRLSRKKLVLGLREHERERIASYVWFTSGAVLLIIFFPQQIAAPCILAAAIGDPMLGITRNLRRRYTFTINYLIIFFIFFLFLYPLYLIVLFAAGVVLVSEAVEFRVQWRLRGHLFYSRSKDTVSKYNKFFEFLFKTDDDFMMQVIPAVILFLVFNLIPIGMPPELIHMDPEIVRIVG